MTDDGFGSTDDCSKFRESLINGSYHDDIVQLSHDIYRGYI